MSKPAWGCSAVPLPMKIRTKSGTGRAATGGDVTALPDLPDLTGRNSGAVARGETTAFGSPRPSQDDTAGATANCVPTGGARRDCPRVGVSATDDVTDGTVAPRGVERDVRRCDSVDAERPDDTADESGPDDPRDPAESARARGIATAAEPTPRATASAPTRPT